RRDAGEPGGVRGVRAYDGAEAGSKDAGGAAGAGISLSIAPLPDRRRAATLTQEELPEFGIDVFVATPHKKLDVPDDLQDDGRGDYRLGSNPRTVAVVNAIVAALEDAPEAILHPRPSSVNRSPFRCRREGGKTCPADAEEESVRLGVNDPVGEQIPEEAATSVEELVEQILDGPQTQDG